MSWETKTYLHALDEETITEAQRRHTVVVNNVIRVQCDVCDGMVLPFQLIDMRTWPAAFLASLPSGADFCCDGCWTRWEREGVDATDGRPFDEAVMYEWLGAPTATVAASRAVITARQAKYASSAGASMIRTGVRNLGAA